MNDDIDRNTLSGFGERVTKNLEFLIRAREEGHDVHIITALATSLLGLIVLPYEEFNRTGSIDFPDETADDLERQGWKFHLVKSSSFADHLYHLRNSISHRRFAFSSDDRTLEEVTVRFSDRKRGETSDYWSASIEATDLYEFVRRIAALLDDE